MRTVFPSPRFSFLLNLSLSLSFSRHAHTTVSRHNNIVLAVIDIRRFELYDVSSDNFVNLMQQFLNSLQ